MQEKEKRLIAMGIIGGVCLAALLMVIGNWLSRPAASSNGQVTVPDFVGLRSDQVDGSEEYADLELRFTEVHNGDSGVGDHVIYYQNVAAGSRVAEGTQVTLSVNLEYTVMQMPNFVGGRLEAALNTLQAYGAVYNVYYQYTEQADQVGRVAAQQPAYGTAISVLETPVDLTVYTDDPTQSSVGSAPQATAAPQAEPTPEPTTAPQASETPQPTAAPAQNAGEEEESGGLLHRLWQAFTGLFDGGEKTDEVEEATPPPGETDAAPETDSPQDAAPAPTPVVEEGGSQLPDVTGMTYEQAYAALEQAGFYWIYYEHQDGGGQPAETVLSQSPAAGSVIDPTTHIDLVLAR